MINMLINILYKLFPTHPMPDPEGLRFPNDWEARESCMFLRGKSWDNIQSEELRLHWDAFSWLNATYFHYYLPSVIFLSLQEIKKYKQICNLELSIDSVFYFIAMEDVFDEKWKLFSLQQMKLVRIWHTFILKQEHNPELNWHMQNMNNLIDRLHPKMNKISD